MESIEETLITRLKSTENNIIVQIYKAPLYRSCNYICNDKPQDAEFWKRFKCKNKKYRAAGIIYSAPKEKDFRQAICTLKTLLPSKNIAPIKKHCSQSIE